MEREVRIEAARELDKEKAASRLAQSQFTTQVASLTAQRESLQRRLQVLQDTLERERREVRDASSSRVRSVFFPLCTPSPMRCF